MSDFLLAGCGYKKGGTVLHARVCHVRQVVELIMDLEQLLALTIRSANVVTLSQHAAGECERCTRQVIKMFRYRRDTLQELA